MRKLLRVAPRRGHAPEVAAVDVAGVGGVEERASVGGERDVFRDAIAGGEFGRRGRAARGRHRVVAPPPVRFGLEDDVVTRPGHRAHLAVDLVVRRVVPHLGRLAGAGVADPDREVVAARETRLGHAIGQVVRARFAQLRPRAKGQSRPADEGDPGAVGRPGRAGIPVHGRSQIGDARAVGVVDADVAVISAVAHEGELAGVGRPDRGALAAEYAEERPVGFGRHDARVDRRAVDRAVFRVRNPLPVRRQGNIPGFYDAPGLAARRARRPHRALGAARVAGRVGDPPLPVRGVAAQEDHGGAVVGDAQRGQVASVVVFVAGKANRVEIGGRRRVDVAASLLVLDPGDSVSVVGRDQLDRVAGAEHVLDREALGLRGRGGERGEGEDGEEHGTARHGGSPAFGCVGRQWPPGYADTDTMPP